MELLHMLGHNAKWNFDLHFQNDVGDGFIFCAYSFPIDYFEKKKVSGYALDKILLNSIMDFQFYGKKESSELSTGKLHTYPFHPANVEDSGVTSEYILTCIEQAINFQEELGLKKIVIPNYYEHFELKNLTFIIKKVNTWLKANRRQGHEYYMTIPITNHMVVDKEKMESLLGELVAANIVFDGYYIACETKPENRRKISTEIKYLINLSRFFRILNKQEFKIIYAYANWDSLLFFAQTDIDYISVGTFENLRNFSLKRFTTSVEGGGPSDGWYFSEKLLNVVKALYVPLLSDKGVLGVIENEENIFSDIILDEDYVWNNLKIEVQKNYVVAVNSLFNSLAKFPAGKPRIQELLRLVNHASDCYDNLESRGVHLIEESSNYHLDTWKIFLTSL